ncbi:TonB-dependent receptor plug domain-containing protein [Bacteroidota bacterium]
MDGFVFTRWSSRRYAVLTSFHKVIKIGVLSFSCGFLLSSIVSAQQDTSAIQMTYELDEVEAVEDLPAALYPNSLRQISIVNFQEIRQYSERSLPTVLNYLPSVDIRSRGVSSVQSDVSIMGGTFDQSMVLFNGMDVTDPQTGHFSLDLPLALSGMHTIEVLKGPAAGKHGINAYAGAINVITKPSDSLDVAGDVSYGSYKYYNASLNANLPIRNVRNFIALSGTSSEGYIDNTDFKNSTAFIHSTFGDRHQHADIMVGWNDKDFGANAFYTPLFPQQFEETSTLFSAMKYTLKKERFITESSVYWRRHYDRFVLFRKDPSFYENFHRTDVLGAGINASFSTILGVSQIRIKYRYEQIFSTSLGEALNDSLPVKSSEDAAYTYFSGRNHVSASLSQMYQYNKLILNGSMLMHSGTGSLIGFGIYPGMDLAYLLTKHFSLHGSLNRSLRLPTFTDLYYRGPQNQGNPELEPETALTFESGIKYNTAFLQATVSGFIRKGSNTIDWIWQDTIWKSMNHTDLNTSGSEVSVVILPPSRGTILKLDRLRFSYSFMQVDKADNSLISNYTLDYLKHKFTGVIHLGLPLGFYLDLEASYRDRNGTYGYYETPESIPVEKEYDPYTLCDLSFGIQLEYFSVYIAVQNLFDVSYRDIGSVLLPGRWSFIGVKIR